jgi:hypothetical protein
LDTIYPKQGPRGYRAQRESRPASLSRPSLLVVPADHDQLRLHPREPEGGLEAYSGVGSGHEAGLALDGGRGGTSLRGRQSLLLMAVPVRVLVERGLAARRAEVERVPVVVRPQLGLLLVHHHAAHGVFRHASLDVAWRPSLYQTTLYKRKAFKPPAPSAIP